jgi:hypothetical protein
MPIIAGIAAVVSIAGAFVAGGGRPRAVSTAAPPSAPTSAPGTLKATAAPAPPAAGRVHRRIDCASRSSARFPGAFTRRSNLKAGPVVFIGGTFTDAATVREFDGNKFPVLVRNDHTVTVDLVGRGRAVAGLIYGPYPDGEVTLREAYRSITFVACPVVDPSPRYEDGPSQSDADGEPVTFWSGFVGTRRPVCLALDVTIDGARPARRVRMGLGRRCPAPGGALRAVRGSASGRPDDLAAPALR